MNQSSFFCEPSLATDIPPASMGLVWYVCLQRIIVGWTIQRWVEVSWVVFRGVCVGWEGLVEAGMGWVGGRGVLSWRLRSRFGWDGPGCARWWSEIGGVGEECVETGWAEQGRLEKGSSDARVSGLRWAWWAEVDDGPGVCRIGLVWRVDEDAPSVWKKKSIRTHKFNAMSSLQFPFFFSSLSLSLFFFSWYP